MDLVLDYILRLFVEQITLEGRDISLQIGDWRADLFTNTLKVMSPSRAKFRQLACSQFKGLGPSIYALGTQRHKESTRNLRLELLVLS